jgi:hypothetical protein
MKRKKLMLAVGIVLFVAAVFSIWVWRQREYKTGLKVLSAETNFFATSLFANDALFTFAHGHFQHSLDEFKQHRFFTKKEKDGLGSLNICLEYGTLCRAQTFYAAGRTSIAFQKSSLDACLKSVAGLCDLGLERLGFKR